MIESVVSFDSKSTTEMQSRVGLGRSTIYRWMSEDRFPKPYELGGHAVAWLEREIDEWIAQRVRSDSERLLFTIHDLK